MLKMDHELTAKWHELDKVRVGLKDVVVLRPDLRVADGYIQYSTDSGSTWQNLIAVAELKGGKGDPGAPGKDGITPTIGSNGHWYLGDTDTGKPSRGATGPAGPAGPAGAPGKAPVRGTDYWTVADKQEIVSSVIAALPDGTEVSY